MPNQKIVDLPEDTTPAATDFITTVDVSDTTDSPEGSSKKVQIGNLGAASIPDDSVTNAKLANMAQATIKGRAVGAGTGDPTDLTPTQATAILNAFVGDSGSGGTKGLVPAPGAGDAAAGKYLDASGGFSVPPGSGLNTEQVQDTVAAMVVAGSNITITYNDPAGTLTIDSTGGGSIAPLTIDSANTVSQRNTTNNQTFKVHNTDDGAGNARWIQFTFTGGNGEILSTGTGSTGPQNLVLRVSGGGNGIILSTGSLSPVTDRGLSLGGGSNRWDTITGFDVVSNGGIFRSQNNWDLHGYGAGFMKMSAGGSTGGEMRFTMGDQNSGISLQKPNGVNDYFEVKSGDANNFKGIRSQYWKGNPVTVANLPTGVEGMMVPVTDSTTATWGATITGGGSNHVLAYYNGSAWTVAAA